MPQQTHCEQSEEFLQHPGPDGFTFLVSVCSGHLSPFHLLLCSLFHTSCAFSFFFFFNLLLHSHTLNCSRFPSHCFCFLPHLTWRSSRSRYVPLLSQMLPAVSLVVVGTQGCCKNSSTTHFAFLLLLSLLSPSPLWWALLLTNTQESCQCKVWQSQIGGNSCPVPSGQGQELSSKTGAREKSQHVIIWVYCEIFPVQYIFTSSFTWWSCFPTTHASNPFPLWAEFSAYSSSCNNVFFLMFLCILSHGSSHQKKLRRKVCGTTPEFLSFRVSSGLASKP